MMDEKLNATLDKVVLLTTLNPEFNIELRKRLGMNSCVVPARKNEDIKDDVSAIREALEIRADKSITYDFIPDKYQRLRDQLIIDNLRMENAALNLKETEAFRFYTFCVNAFYQLENIVNYYFFIIYPEINDLLKCIEEMTQKENPEFQFHRRVKNTEKTVGDIHIAHKLNAICNILFPEDDIKITCSQLRQVRNEGEHRCMIIIKSQSEKNSLYNFFKFHSFNSVRATLIRLINEVRRSIQNYERERKIEAEITNILPGACFVKFNGNITSLPSQLLKFIKYNHVGDMIELITQKGKIVSVIHKAEE